MPDLAAWLLSEASRDVFDSPVLTGSPEGVSSGVLDFVPSTFYAGKGFLPATGNVEFPKNGLTVPGSVPVGSVRFDLSTFGSGDSSVA